MDGYVESETLLRHLKNIPKSSFPNISSKLIHESLIRTSQRLLIYFAFLLMLFDVLVSKGF